MYLYIYGIKRIFIFINAGKKNFNISYNCIKNLSLVGGSPCNGKCDILNQPGGLYMHSNFNLADFREVFFTPSFFMKTNLITAFIYTAFLWYKGEHHGTYIRW